MAEAKSISTRIVLRNDTLANWEASEKTLMKGEVALALRDDGAFEVRVGDGAHTWNELSNTGFGHTGYYAKSSFAELSALSCVPNGSIGVVTESIGGDAVQKTAYSYNAVQKRWEALDGNYSAENVYFKSDFSLAGDYTQVGNVKLSEGTLAASGKSVKALFEDIFDKTIQPTMGSNPTNSVTLNGAGCYEVGTKKIPSYSVSYTQGKYNNPWNNTTSNDGTEASAWTVSNGTTTKTTQTGSFDEITVVDGTNYKLTASTGYTAGTVAKDNKGNNSNPEIKRAAGTTANANSSSITGFRYVYVGSIATDAEVTESVIKGLSNKYKTSDIGSGGITKTLKASGGDIPLVSGAVKVIVACPTGTYAKNLNQVLLVSASNTPITSDYKAKTNVSVSGATDGENKIDYKVWVYQPASIDAGEVHAITIK